MYRTFIYITYNMPHVSTWLLALTYRRWAGNCHEHEWNNSNKEKLFLFLYSYSASCTWIFSLSMRFVGFLPFASFPKIKLLNPSFISTILLPSLSGRGKMSEIDKKFVGGFILPSFVPSPQFWKRSRFWSALRTWGQR